MSPSRVSEIVLHEFAKPASAQASKFQVKELAELQDEAP